MVISNADVVAAFERMLMAYVPRVGWSAPSKMQVLSLGCGTGLEVQALLNYFGKDLSYVGIDNSEEKISEARKLHKDILNARFVCGDAARLDSYLSSPVDLLLARHTFALTHVLEWRTIFLSAHRVTKTNSLLIGTALMDPEYSALEKVVLAAGFRKSQVSGLNEQAIQITPDVGYDRNILFAFA